MSGKENFRPKCQPSSFTINSNEKSYKIKEANKQPHRQNISLEYFLVVIIGKKEKKKTGSLIAKFQMRDFGKSSA